ncbi:MAG: alpha/beta fold hydrolase [Bacilli bacterium]
MKMKIMDVNLNYQRYGNIEGKTIVLLHGWGQNIDMMKPIGDRFTKDFDIVIFDLPGFGHSSEPKEFFSCYDYVELIHKALEELKVEKPIIIGHSFGGKLGLLYASKYETEKLVCLASPFCKEIQKVTMKAKLLKALKKVPLLNKLEDFAKRHMGSTDYRNASGVMRNILVGHVNLDIKEDIKKIKCPTLLIWGTNDEAVSIERAYELEKLIKDAGLVVYEGCTHYAYLERLGQTISVLKSFLG